MCTQLVLFVMIGRIKENRSEYGVSQLMEEFIDVILPLHTVLTTDVNTITII